ncbi:MAG: SPOR domain-containing protein [Pseudomonadota bacterium]|uniref:cell division protein FtsN n=1 Tax=Phenylobacterium sp. TaxID=1871053 RepID=UPI0025D0A7CA|nr:SPOR domain-containing protein [Phenylobacterium sp.]MBT9469766.1 SPOR domain-containing protein [Phenylobacterium sp.]
MSDPDRGAYTPPTDAPLSFDARQPVRGGGPAPVMLILSAIVLIALVIAIVLFYRSGVREAGQPPLTVGAPVTEMKGAAPAEAQPVDPAEGLQIYQSEQGEAAPASPNFTAPPETPQARPAPVTVQPPPKAAPTAPVASAPIVALPAAPTASTGLKPAVPPPPPAAVPVTKIVPPPKAATPAPKSIDAALNPTPAPKASGGGAAVQIGAFSSQALADKGWNDAARIAPGAAAGKGKRVEAIQKDGSTLYRTQVTGFASRADASAFCNQLKAAGKSCFVK